MHFKRLTLKNFGPHAELELKFNRGSVGIFGPNGSGKSTVLDAMYSLVTNDFSRFDGRKSDCVRTTAGDKEKSFISGEIVHNDISMIITRGVRPASHSLVIDGKEITNENKIEETLDQVLGVDRSMLDRYVFKRQGGIFDFLDITPAARAKAYQTLCRTELCEDIWEMIGRLLTQDSELRGEILDNSDELSARLGELETEIGQIESEKAKQEELLLSPANKERADAIIRKRDDAIRLTRKLGEKQKDLEALDVSIRSTTESHEKLQKNFDKAEKERSRLKASAESAAAALKNWSAYSRRMKRRKEIETELADVAKSRKEQAPEPVTASSIDGVTQQIADRKAELAAAEKLVDLVKSGEKQCPTCGSDVTELSQAVLESAKRDKKQLPEKIVGLRCQLDDYKKGRDLHEAYDRRQSDLASRQATLKSELASFNDTDEPEGDRDELQEVADRYAEATSAYVSAEMSFRGSQQSLAEFAGQKKTLVANLREIAQELEAATVSDEIFEKAQRRLAENSDAMIQMGVLSGRLRSCRETSRSCTEQLESLRAKLKRSQRVRVLRGILERGREVVHRDGIPRFVARSNLAAMEGRINESLEMFGSPFWVETGEDLSFVAHKPGEPPHSAGRLSGGQKVVLAVSFWSAVASLWRADLGLMVLDEPTFFLDAPNRALLAELVRNMTASVRGRCQILMTSHADELRPAFDQIIQIGG